MVEGAPDRGSRRRRVLTLAYGCRLRASEVVRLRAGELRIYDLYRRGIERKAVETDGSCIASPRAFPVVQGSGRAHEGTD
jgi:hypothetical protein